MIVESTFKPLACLANKHLQTLYAPLSLSVSYQPNHWSKVVFDDDFMEVAWFGDFSSVQSDDAIFDSYASRDSDVPILVICHGLEGSYQSHYIQRVIAAALKLNWQVAVLHFRSCGRELNNRMESYHSGASGDLDVFAEHLEKNFHNRIKFIAGFSLGGNVLLKWLGENPSQTVFTSAMSVSVPLKLDVCATAIDKGISKIYQKHLVDSLKYKVNAKLIAGFSSAKLKLTKPLSKIRNFWQFDEQVTAPLNGFKNAEDYYRQSSSYAFLSQIKTRTLMLHSMDDPFMDPTVIPAKEDLGQGITLEISTAGGHLGFIDRLELKSGECFLARRTLEFFSQHISAV